MPVKEILAHDASRFSSANTTPAVVPEQSPLRRTRQASSPTSRLTMPTELNTQAAACNHLETLTLALLHSQNAVGDKNQCEGIANALEAKLEKKALKLTTQTVFLDSALSMAAFRHQIKEDSSKTNSTDTGKSGLALIVSSSQNIVGELPDILSSTQAFPGRLVSVFSSHMLFKDLAQCDALPDIVAVPESAARLLDSNTLGDLREKTTLVLSTGVPHNVNPKTLAEETSVYLAKGNPPIPPVNANTVGIILPGDAPDETGKIQCFSPEHAKTLATQIFGREVKDSNRAACHFIVTNGPRTGKYDDSGNEIQPSPHRIHSLDASTKAFVETLGALSTKDRPVQITVLDFQFNHLPSAYKPLLGAFCGAKERGAFYVPGESTSMVDEVTSLLPGSIILEAQSMNQTHHEFTQEVLRDGTHSFLQLNGSLKQPISTHQTPSQRSQYGAAENIAEAILQNFARPLEPASLA